MKRSFLLNSAKAQEVGGIPASYDDERQVNVVQRDGGLVPIVNENWFAQTMSKTMQAPGDDDPDPDDMACY